ncbi:uncharacterized protein BCR38DRAFT_412485 [Pseudomassariella vexata]|uniref:Uncharacterized protein n=1 Tax=Pseudomassariella vexata TaxID=1141098 RepID=A0A1Y2DJP0_9PEZI|nr:uncharacterized protein BCR38DRAFT_412485 [Pseudomassariella vexata]ORY59468.1 hypothetical protein BCR38DRAFT_412485 [Pseudomassariella vexata]
MHNSSQYNTAIFPSSQDSLNYYSNHPQRTERVALEPSNTTVLKYKIMDKLFSVFKATPKTGTIADFIKLHPYVERLANHMYGKTNITKMAYGKVSDTAYIIIMLDHAPIGAEGSVQESFLRLNANFYEVLKDQFDHETYKILIKRGHWVAPVGIHEEFDVFVNHPISGRLIVAPIDKQKQYMRSM